jgi:GDPmannose 4,6-dehydratase
LTRVDAGMQSCLYLGNLEARRDWGHARDYVEAQWLMLQQERAQDFVIATGRQHSVRDFVEKSAAHLDMRIEWRGSGLHELGINRKTGQTVVRIDPRYFRPAEVDALLGDASKARAELGWTPRVGFDDLVREMIEADMALARRDALVRREGYRVAQAND